MLNPIVCSLGRVAHHRNMNLFCYGRHDEEAVFNGKRHIEVIVGIVELVTGKPHEIRSGIGPLGGCGPVVREVLFGVQVVAHRDIIPTDVLLGAVVGLFGGMAFHLYVNRYLFDDELAVLDLEHDVAEIGVVIRELVADEAHGIGACIGFLHASRSAIREVDGL